MNKLVKALLSAFTVVCCLCAVCLPAFAASSTSTYTPNTNGSYKPTMAQAEATVTLQDFQEPGVTINKKTHAIYNVYDSNGDLVPATLSTDGHFYIVPTTTGYYYITTGR